MENLELPVEITETFDKALDTDAQDEIIDELELEGQSTEGVDPVKVAKALWRWIRKKIDDYNG